MGRTALPVEGPARHLFITEARRQRPDSEKEETKMKRRTLDLFFASGGLVVAVLLAVLGYAIQTQYQFATEYAATELGAQKIVFTAADKLTDEEKTWKAGSACLVT